MESNFLGLMGAGLAMGISALGAAIAMGITGSATIGAWKRCYKANRPIPMTLLAFVGFPLTEVFYGYILMSQMLTPEIAIAANNGLLLSMGLGAGITIGAVAVAEGYVGAAAADALSDTGKGFASYIAVVGVCETVALFAMVLSMTLL